MEEDADKNEQDIGIRYDDDAKNDKTCRDECGDE